MTSLTAGEADEGEFHEKFDGIHVIRGLLLGKVHEILARCRSNRDLPAEK
jgi:hypothetical protein